MARSDLTYTKNNNMFSIHLMGVSHFHTYKVHEFRGVYILFQKSVGIYYSRKLDRGYICNEIVRIEKIN